ncbi:lipopolysaccharide assembly protein LapB [Denitratisoma sp. DHT3]|uniref:lipopolysaccharide assembly protein LapB n=1 Tax=Denitratisoma sp. DHT3 TaxID=1981880 RepID=UPI001198833C|nr:lipopolysaccharide assembly protein LapB [Denitratisoma sp. DHT3]QDX82613.1 lipopolysaccharide assembly protein LapB [Denitratisoma sp. DHT3]
MEIQLWWLLALPAFFILGWVAARIDIKHLVRESRALPRSYFRGLNFLLNEQPDKAIEAFLEAAKVDTETIELHFALGSLFRRRGETDRAIRVHQNLVDRDGLSAEQRLHALSELGQDYLKAGLLDRAEGIFLKLRGTIRDEDALRFLLEIYQQEKEWAKAIDTAAAMPGHADHIWQKEMAEFHCELAASELLHGRSDAARQHLDEALRANRKCVRATILQGDLAWNDNDAEGAIEAWKRVEGQSPAYLALVAGKLVEAHVRLGRAEQGLQLLRGYLERNPSLDLLDVVAQMTLQESGPEAAYQLVRDELRRNPTLLGLNKLLEAQVTMAPPERRSDLELVRNLIHAHTRRVARYRCDSCGFKARQFHWRCPACGGWETYPPRRTEEFDLAP